MIEADYHKFATSLAEIRTIFNYFPGPDREAASATMEREKILIKPAGSLGCLEELSLWLASWQGRHPPEISHPRVVVFAGNHGVAAQGVSLFPAEVTTQMVANFVSGGAAINQICRTIDTDLRVYEMSLDKPTHDFTLAPAMSDAECSHAIAYGMMAVEPGVDLLAIGEMGIANTTSASALCHALYGNTAAFWVGPGTGVCGSLLANKQRVIAEGVNRHGKAGDGLDFLAALGGREMAAIVGAVIAARMARVPVLLDGFICTAAASCLTSIDPHALDHCMVSHCSAEPGHQKLLTIINKKPLLDLGMRLGEGTGAAIAIAICKAAAACHGGMATFAEAGVSGSVA